VGELLETKTPANLTHKLNDPVQIGSTKVGLCWLIGIRGSNCESRVKTLEEKKNNLNALKHFYTENPPKCTSSGDDSDNTEDAFGAGRKKRSTKQQGMQ